MEKLFQPKLTDKEVAEGAPVRDSFRKTLLNNQSFLSVAPDVFAETPLKNDVKPLIQLVDKELAWVNANVEVSKRIVTTREKEFNETMKTQYEELKKKVKETFGGLPGPKQDQILIFFKNDPIVNELRTTAQSQIQAKEQEQLKEKNQKLNRSTTDIAVDAWNKVKGKLFKWLFYITLFVLALRAGSFAVNDNLWRPLPYRILLFIYTILFFPITIPYYYIYRELRGRFSSVPDMIPHMEGLFPATPYDPKPEPSLTERAFGYANTDALQAWLKQKLEDLKMLRQQSLVTSILDQLKEQDASKV